MADDNYNNCAYGEQAVSYLYDEIDARGKVVFEEHLRVCTTCAAEIAGFGAVRASVLQWKTEEFQLLNTPKIEFQDASAKSENNINTVPIKPNSWIERFSKFFIPAPVWTASFASIIVLSALLLFVYNFSNNNQIVEVGTENSQPANVSSKNFNKETEISERTISGQAKQVFEEELPEAGKPANKNLIAKDLAADKTSVRVAPAVKNEQIILSKTYPEVSRKNISLPARKFGNSNTVAARKIPARRLQIPKLNSIEDTEEETTLRLTDLFEEVGGK